MTRDDVNCEVEEAKKILIDKKEEMARDKVKSFVEETKITS